MDDDGRVDGRATHIDGDIDLPLPEKLIDHLIEAREIALALDQITLRRLIEAVMLEAGRTFAPAEPQPLDHG